MNRRTFLELLAAGFALDPERLLWRPGAKTIFLPPKTIFLPPMPGGLFNPAREIARLYRKAVFEDADFFHLVSVTVHRHTVGQNRLTAPSAQA